MKRFAVKKDSYLRKTFVYGVEGFTFIELIVVLSVIGIIVSTVGVSINQINSDTRLSNAASRALADVRYAQEMAMTHRREVDVFVTTSSDKYEVKWHDTGSYVSSPVDGNDLIVNFNQDEYKDVAITSSGLGGRLSFTSIGEPLINGSSFSSPTSVVHLNSKIYVFIYSSGYSCLEQSAEGGGC